MKTLELRFASALRADMRGGTRRLVGYAARYGVTADLGIFRERLSAGAFAESVGEGGASDIVALLDHDPAKVLGRTRTGTLALTDDAQGLAFDITVPDTTAGRDALALAERGDLGGASIGFIVENEAREDGVRVIKRARLIEISVVSAWPAYVETTVEARRRAISAVAPPGRTPRRDRLGRFLDTV